MTSLGLVAVLAVLQMPLATAPTPTSDEAKLMLPLRMGRFVLRRVSVNTPPLQPGARGVYQLDGDPLTPAELRKAGMPLEALEPVSATFNIVYQGVDPIELEGVKPVSVGARRGTMQGKTVYAQRTIRWAADGWWFTFELASFPPRAPKAEVAIVQQASTEASRWVDRFLDTAKRPPAEELKKHRSAIEALPR